MTEGAILKELPKKQLDLEIAIKTDASAEAIPTTERQRVWPQWDYRYRLDHQSSGVVLAAGKVKAIDGGSAAQQIAEPVVKRVAGARKPTVKDNSQMRLIGSFNSVRVGDKYLTNRVRW